MMDILIEHLKAIQSFFFQGAWNNMDSQLYTKKYGKIVLNMDKNIHHHVNNKC